MDRRSQINQEQLLVDIQSKFENLEKQRLIDIQQISHFSKNYFQEWLDLNAFSCFQQEITAQSSVERDWANLTNICSQMKFYSPLTVAKMTKLFGVKWGIFANDNPAETRAGPASQSRSDVSFRDSNPGVVDVAAGKRPCHRTAVIQTDQDKDRPRSSDVRNINEVVELVHESPFILLLLQSMKDIALYIERKQMKERKHSARDEQAALSPDILHKIQTYQKICALYEVLSFNYLNQILIMKIKAPQFLV